MADSTADAAVALMLMLESLRLLDGQNTVAGHLLKVIDELAPEKPTGPSSDLGREVASREA